MRYCSYTAVAALSWCLWKRLSGLCAGDRHGPAFGTGVTGEMQGDRLVDRLAAAGRRCVLVDRQDMLSRHVTGTARQAWQSCGVL